MNTFQGLDPARVFPMGTDLNRSNKLFPLIIAAPPFLINLPGAASLVFFDEGRFPIGISGPGAPLAVPLRLG